MSLRQFWRRRSLSLRSGEPRNEISPAAEREERVESAGGKANVHGKQERTVSAKQSERVHEVVGIFHTTADLQNAIDDLLSAGFDRAELSFLASAHAVEQKLGHAYRKVSDIADDSNVPRAAYVSTEAIGGAQGALIGGLFYVGAVVAAGAVVVSGGALAAAFAAAAIAGGAGGFVGSLLAYAVGDHHANYLQEQIEKGGLLLWVHSRDEDHQARSIGILKMHCGDNVHVHETAMAASVSATAFELAREHRRAEGQ